MAGSKPRPFFDSNVLFSAFYNPNSVPGELLRQHVQDVLSIVVSSLVLREVARSLRRKQASRFPELDAFLRNTPPEIVAAPSAAAIRAVEHCINAKDAPILAAAIASGADCIVSGNTHHFNQQAAECAGIAIFTPAAYLAALDRSNGIR